jgi:alpha-galactosidase
MKMTSRIYILKSFKTAAWPSILLGVLLGSQPAAKAVDDGLARTPPMGWNSWNKFGGNINEAIIRQAAEAMATNGMKEAGYAYINIDDCWHGKRDERGFIQADPQRFPSGMKALADYVHVLGLKLGIYSDAGWRTCAGRPGSRGHEYQDALTYAEWGIDYLKYDWCNADNLKAEGAYATMHAALRAAGRPILFSLCEWGSNKPWLWGKNVGHLWRTTGDITPRFAGGGRGLSVLRILDLQKDLRQYAGPGHWNDPDMLEVGNGMSVNEDRAHFSMWCMLAAPLIAGNDLPSMPKTTLDILANKELIAIDQDALGVQGFVYQTNQNVEVWFKPLSNDAWAMCLLNRTNTAQKVSFDWKSEPVDDTLAKREAHFDTTTYAVRNLWSNEDAGSTAKPLDVEVPGHDVLAFRLSK